MKVWFWGVLAILLLGGAGVVGYLESQPGGLAALRIPADIRAAEAEFDEQWNQAVALGLDKPWREARPVADVLPEENSASILLGLSVPASTGPDDQTWSKIRPPYDSDYVTKVADFAPFASAIEAAERASKMGPAYFSPAYEEQKIFRTFRPMKDVQRLLSARSVVHLREDREAEAVRDLETAIRLCEVFPLDMGSLPLATRTSCLTIAARSLLMSAEDIQKPESFARLRRAFDEHLTTPDLRSVLMMAMYEDIASIRNLAAMGGEKAAFGEEVLMVPENVPIIESGAPQSPYERAFATRYLQTMLPLLEADRETVITTLIGMEADLAGRTDKSWAYMKRLMVSPQTIIRVCLQFDMAKQGMAAYAAVLEFQRRTGRWPESLAEADADRLDPVDGQPLRYRVEGDGFVIWSVGENMTDEGGVASYEIAPYNSRGDDYTFPYPWPTFEDPDTPPLPAGSPDPPAAP